jgi:hypothetical protein
LSLFFLNSILKLLIGETLRAVQSRLKRSDPKGAEYDRFSLDWTARSVSPISNFKIEFKKNSDNVWQSYEVEAFNLKGEDNIYTGTHMIDSLTPAAVYLAQVSSRNVYGYSAPSETFKFATRGADPVQKPLGASGAVPNNGHFVSSFCLSLVALYLMH